MTTTAILSRLEKVKPNGQSRWMACCPAHKDRTPSLSVRESEDGKTLLRCMAGCTFESIVSALSLSPKELFPDKPTDPQTAREQKDQYEKEKREHQARVRAAISEWMKQWPLATGHKYLEGKKLKPRGNVRICTAESRKGWLVIPLYDDKGVMQTLQYISEDGQKTFQSGGKQEGCMFLVHESDTGPILITEGYATGVSVADATGWTTVCAFSCGQLTAVARIIKKEFPDRLIIIAGDNDEGTEGNPGKTKAEEAAKAVGGVSVVPNFPRR